MSEPVPLDYAEGRRTWSAPAIAAIVLGVCSGPIVVVLVRLSGIAYGISIVGSAIAGTIGVAVAAYCIWAYRRARCQPRMRGRSLALIGLAATTLWAVGLIALFCYVDAHLE
jgi:uncharacterized integral membrane protein